jgi:hypothetical protein
MTEYNETIYQQLSSEIANLHGNWKMLKQLFGESEERIELMNRTASSFFCVIQNALLVDLCVRFSRLTDPATIGGHENLVIGQILGLPCCRENQALYEELLKQIESLQTICEPIRKHRNKAIAHSDLATAMKTEPLPVVLEQTIEKALLALAGVWNTMQRSVDNTATNFPKFAFQGGDADALIHALEQAEQWKKRAKRF